MKISKLTVATLGIVFTGCTTVPDDAPQVFHDAQASIERMDENDVDEYLPRTAERANESFDKALDLLEEHRDLELKTEPALAMDRAIEAKTTADGANRLYSNIKSWDKNDSSFQEALAMLDEMENPTVDVAIVDQRSPFAKLKGAEFVSTLAYFDTAKAEDPNYNSEEMEALVNILKKDKDYRVILTGYADPRGDNEYNRKLAMDRAEAIAGSLKERGISPKQMVVNSGGETNTIEGSSDREKLQLDRKVKAKLVLR